MKVYHNNKLIVDSPLNYSCIHLSHAIKGDCGTMIPYENKEFLISIKPLMDEVVNEMETSWKEVDYKSSKVYFYICENTINLSVEVFPRYYSAKEKQTMYAAARHKEEEDGGNDLLELMDMFDEIDQILNCSCPIGEVGVYPLELTAEEINILLSINL